MIRSTNEVIADIKVLVNTESYIYSLCLILFEDFHLDMNKMHEVDYRSKLSVKESSFLIGFLVQKEIDFTYPTSSSEVLRLVNRTYELMRELHDSFNAPQFEKLLKIIERQESGEVIENTYEDRLNFFIKENGIVEPLFYAGDGVYDFQYLEFLHAKYKYDGKWLSENKSFDISLNIDLVHKIKQVLRVKAKKVKLLDLRERFPEIASKARKKLKKVYTQNQVEEIERQQLEMVTFYQYKELFSIPDDFKKDNREGWQTFYKNLLDLFVVVPSDFQEMDSKGIKNFFENFSFRPGCNLDYKGPGHFNILNSRPFIELEDERYFIPILYLVSEAVYESPFYWMWDDKKYRDTLAKHRGDVGEEVAHDFLIRVFGSNNTFRSVRVEDAKGRTETDIDVLCLLGSKALCVQVKSKKLTLAARRGDFDQLSSDFKGAIQDAYNQGLVSRRALKNGNSKFFDANGSAIVVPNVIDEVYILGLTTENYPALVHQVQMMLVKDEQEPYPLFISVFDLELLVHYLKDPYDFLYYVRQRIDLTDYFKADEEIVYLGYHLDRKLWRVDGFDGGVLENNYGAIIDRNYYPYKIGIAHLLSEADDPIHNLPKDPHFDAFLDGIKLMNHPKATDIVFHLLDWSGETRKNVVNQMFKIKEISKREGKTKSIATPSVNFGISYIVLFSASTEELAERVATYARLRKYMTKCDSWLGIGSFAHSKNLVDFIVYYDDPWKVDTELETKYADKISAMKSTPLTSLKGEKKIGRNDPCPCKSGKKYKKCCGMQ